MAPPHIRLINSKLLALAGRAIRFLIVTVPPRHGKSELISKYFPAWYVGMFPDHRVMLVSYEHEFAAGWGRRSRDLLGLYGNRFGVSVREDVAARNQWETTAGGGMVTAGIGGGVTGRGADVIIVDDPHKNAEDALSQTMREKVWDYWQSTLYTRLEPNGVVVFVQTRWHEADLTGRALTEGSLPWDVVNLPALALDDDAVGRAPGEALWPERYDAAALHQMRANMHAYWWSALYQQSPVPLGDTMFRPNWMGHFSEMHGIYMLWQPGATSPLLYSKSRCQHFGMMDLAASTKTTADYTVLTSFALTPDSHLLTLHVDRRRLEGPDQVPMMREAIKRHSLSFVGVENVAYQLTLIQAGRRAGLPIRAIKADGDKVSRALTASALQEGGKLFVPKAGAHWLADFERELYAFPTAPHDDQVDTVAFGAIYSTQRALEGTFA